MSNPIPAHLQPAVEEHLRYRDSGGGMDTDDRVRLFADLLVANAVPFNMEAEVREAIDDGWLSPAGDIMRRADDGY